MTALTRRELLRNSVLSGAGLFIAFHIPSKVRAAPAPAKQPPNPDYIPGTMLLTTIGDASDGLTPRQRRILQLRFGLIDGHRHFGTLTLYVTTVLGLLVLAMVLVRRRPPILNVLLIVAVIAASGVTAYYVYRTGDSAARIVWKGY